MIFQIYEQKYLELIEDGEALEGVKCLRQDLAPLNIQTEHLQKLAQILLVQVVINKNDISLNPLNRIKSRFTRS